MMAIIKMSIRKSSVEHHLKPSWAPVLPSVLGFGEQGAGCKVVEEIPTIFLGRQQDQPRNGEAFGNPYNGGGQGTARRRLL